MHVFPGYLSLETSDTNSDQLGRQWLLKNMLHATKYQDWYLKGENMVSEDQAFS